MTYNWTPELLEERYKENPDLEKVNNLPTERTGSPPVARKARTGNKPLEKHIEAFVRGAAITLGWKYYHTWRSIHSPAGFPDDVLVRPPRIIFAELKRDGAELSGEQEVWAELLKRCPGVEYYVWHNYDQDEIINILK